MIIDGHCHAGHGDGLTGPWDTNAPLGDYLARASEAGITRTVLMAAFHSDYAVANKEVAAIVQSDPRRFIGFVFVNPVKDAGRIEAMVRTMVLRHGFRGIKAHQHDSKLTREVCRVAAAYGLPVLYDVTGHTTQIELLATEYPRVRFIIPHLGSFADDWAAQRRVIDLMVRHRNVYADTSGVRRFDLLAEAIERAGPGKVIFGTDGPWLHPAVELSKIEQLGLAPVARSAVLGGNLLRLLGPHRRSYPRPVRHAARPGAVAGPAR
jgi:predicted TIM-barrel fold metal-dependent hydrolase